MEHADRQVLRLLRVFLINNIQNVEGLLDYMETNGVVSVYTREKILSHSTVTCRIRELLDSIVRCGPKAYGVLKLALKETHQLHVLEAIEVKEHSMAGVNSRDVQMPQRAQDQKLDIFIPDKVTSHPLKPYDVSSMPHGYVLIVDISEYHITSGLTNRTGSAQDANALKSLFEDFRYSVALARNLESEQLKCTVAEFAAKTEHELVHAAVLVILAHGVQHNIIASDGALVSIDQLVGFFTNRKCPRLAGKPKMIIIQACRGDEVDYNSVPNDDRDSSTPIGAAEVSLDPRSWLSPPYMSDSVIVYSTLPGFVSWRSETEGSWYVRTLVDVFRLHGHRLHVLELLTEVNNRMLSESTTLGIHQISQPATTLTKPFFLSTTSR